MSETSLTLRVSAADSSSNSLSLFRNSSTLALSSSTVNDYRNPAVTEGMQILGYVNMLNHGIPEVQRELEENGNGKAVFTIDRITVFEAKLIESGKWRSAVDTENLPVNQPVELAQVRKKINLFF